MFATDVRLLTPGVVNTGRPIDSPHATWLTLARLRLAHNGSHCLFYRVPHPDPSKKMPGILRVVVLGDGQECNGNFDGFKVAELSNVQDLTVTFVTDETHALARSLRSRPFHFNLSFQRQGTWNVIIPMINVKENGALAYKHQRYSSSAPNGWEKGLSAWPGGPLAIPVGEMRNGSWDDSYAERESHLCHDVSDDCRTVKAFECDKCRYGWFETVRASCPQGGPKFCGTDRCGERGWPACPRGFEYEAGIPENGCEKDSKAGFCQEGLVPTCDEKNILVCL